MSDDEVNRIRTELGWWLIPHNKQRGHSTTEARRPVTPKVAGSTPAVPAKKNQK